MRQDYNYLLDFCELKTDNFGNPNFNIEYFTWADCFRISFKKSLLKDPSKLPNGKLIFT
jgi:hypothetical protein